MKKKIKSQKGFTLIEMLAASLVLILLALILNTGLNTAMKSYRKMTAESETEVLLSSLTNTLSDELRYARDIVTKENGDLDRYLSVSYGRNTTLTVEDGQLYANGKRVLASGAYGNGAYTIESFEIKYDKDKEVFTVNLKVKNAENISAEASLEIRPLNSIGGGE